MLDSCGTLGRLVWSILVVGVAFLPHTYSECNVCSVANNLACVSPTEFKICTNNAPSGSIYSCNPGQLCDINARCVSNETSPVVPCGDCNTCDSSNVFACQGTRSFALCLGDATPSLIVGECNIGYVCNVDNPYICARAGEGYNPTCSYVDDEATVEPDTTTTSTTSTTTTTTPSPITQPTQYCNVLGKSGRFPVGTNLNTTCKQYILCIANNNAFIGALYYCPNNYYFDDTTRACVLTAPARCSGRIRSLSLDHIQLL